MAQIIKLRNTPTPVLDITYVNVTYASFLLPGEEEYVPNIRYDTDGAVLIDATDSSDIVAYPNYIYVDSDPIESALGSLSVNARGF